MSIPTPRDATLGSRAAALVDGTALAERLGMECRPRYARYKPNASLLVQYDVAFEERPLLAHAWLFADGRAARTWHSASFRRLLERARHRHPDLPLHALYVDDLNVLVEVAPVDSRLPALVRAASARKVARLLGDRLLRKADVAIVRHKPGRKALLRMNDVYVKVYANGTSRRRFTLARDVAAHGVSTARPIAELPELGAVAYAAARGERLADLRGDAGYAAWLRPVVDALRTFHTRAPLDARRPSERVRVAAAGRAVDALLPALHGAGARLAAEINKTIAAYDAVPVLTHGDFYDDQLLVGPEHVALLDLDEARPGHPLVDVGNFLAHLSVRSEEDHRAAFLEASADAGFDLTGVLAFEAAALLALAVRPFRHLEPDWPERVEELVELAAGRLRADRSRRSAADPKLPQLHNLVDHIAARPALERALGRPVDVCAVRVLRHKRGRRCTLRYRFDDGTSVYAKTYASGRAARVHETYHRLATRSALPIPLPLGWDEDARLVVTAPLPGRSVRRRLASANRRLGEEIAELLHAFHSSGVVLARRHTLEDELSPLRARVERLSAAAPALAATAQRCVVLATSGSEREWSWRWRPIHRDFYEDQLLENGAGLALLDVDDAAMSEPAVDVANLIAHLRLRALRRASGPEGPRTVSRVFLRRYQALDDALDPRLVTFLVGATLLRLTEIHLPRLSAPVALALLARSERALRLGLAGAP